jgi:uncharacterized protein DUF4037
VTQTCWQDDLVLRSLIQVAEADPETIGLFLSGSRGAGLPGPESDYDIAWVLTDAAYQRREGRVEAPLVGGRTRIDLHPTCPAELAAKAAAPGWWTYGTSTAQVLLDKTGEVAAALRAYAMMPEEKAQADAAGWFDAYLNAFYRSMKAWRRGDELGGRLQATDSVMHLVRTLFSLERRWTPYHDHLRIELETLGGQGWPPGYLNETLLRLVATGDLTLQQELEVRVEALMRERGHGHVVDAWDGEIERVKAFRFDRER